MIETEFKKIINVIKEDIKKAQIKTAIQVNKNLIMLYFRLGKILYDNFKYGNKFIDEISRELRLEYPNSKGYSVRNLKYMKKFYLEYKDNESVQQLVAQVPWGHNIVLMEKIANIEIRTVYIRGIIENNWGREMLIHQIENEYHLRIGNSNNNFKTSLPATDSDLANYIVKDPYVFDFVSLNNNYKEQDLEVAMINKVKDLLLELGKGFSFVGNQYKVSMHDKDYYIDLLFYHLELRCYIVVELKSTAFKPDFIGQLSFYITAIDETLKKDFDNSTIGLLLCREKDRLSVEWSLKGTNLPIGVSSYKIDECMPKGILEKLPTEEEINLHINFREK